MLLDKSLGPDGFNSEFYQQFLGVCGDDIFEDATTWLGRGYFLPSLNDTNICLVPKCVNPHSMKDFLHISMCNVVYKLVSRLLANRVKNCLSKCVSEEQSTFLEGRCILDNAMFAIKSIHALKIKTSGNKAQLSLKIDISKAFDRVDRGFPKGMLERMGFVGKWIHWIMM